MGSNSTVETPTDQPLILFDGVCNLCNDSINFIIDHDSDKKFKFAPLQGDEAKNILPDEILENTDSVVLIKKDRIYTKSTAALMIAKQLDGFWPIFWVFLAIPTFIRNPVYDFIAKNRYKWFGKRETCRFPEPEIEDRFIEKSE